ncbi:1,2-dihydroxy-3-keto-5-methylthiopentene dioxygenase [Streptoalloteichus tenebrarius]|uniref:Acireductone dioxygenase n=1 Tax=Streptoalloteichus tenebrarius (strain ATCC 17920 / DSM 40477 / JCM 4838 / CBS 697.72 / NBRC 16177 / NCIMB 11028 / NRRL B-12390 / A12253. 1 / ISP 5477) TaxID=1933 RepID=A0ABT1HUA6_STRSD|nr:cupin [Streptoalloteichus tenebrarius]MCP2259099.1 1,2-dihydroxy-3-keto-5-methylthiopentene dioxygenase [Streptoalloteichus tenebrarius]BFE99575.1 acireductone dioxygenase [Streptoalloteichus tenebrarius]
MTSLTVWPDTDPDTELVRTEDPEEIREHLKQIGVRFERWELVPGLSAEPSSEEVLNAYREHVDRVVEAEGYVLVDAVHMTPSDDPAWAEKATAARQRFLSEHTHDDAEDRFFARGAGVFYLHVGDKVHAVLCEAGDLLSVPANTTHWFDMGVRPDFVAIRFFHDEDGWVGNFTGNPLAEAFPDFDALLARRRGA